MDPAKLALDQATARALIEEFARKPFPGAFPQLDRSKIAFGLNERVTTPSLINQGQAGLCPSAVVVYTLARTDVIDYVRAVIELFDQGKTKIGKWVLNPCRDLRDYKPPASAKIPQCDWIIMASIRDSENWFIDYQSETDDGGAWGNEVAKWLRKAGYTEVKESWNSFFNKNIAHLSEANDLFAKDFQVCLLIDSDLLEGKTAILSRPNHWVVLGSEVKTNFSSPTSNVEMDVFTWGEQKTLPTKAMQLDDFIDYYYGYVAAKF